MIEKIKKWYDGEVVSWGNSQVRGIGIDYHWTARIVRRLVKFYFDHWKWVIGTLLAVIALYFQYID